MRNVKEVGMDFLRRYAETAVAERPGLIIETLAELCQIFGTCVQALPIPNPEETVGRKNLTMAVHVSFMEFYYNHNMAMPRILILFTADSPADFAWLHDPTNGSSEQLTYGRPTGPMVFDFIVEVCKKSTYAQLVEDARTIKA